jgi:hypothetical protein
MLVRALKNAYEQNRLGYHLLAITSNDPEHIGQQYQCIEQAVKINLEQDEDTKIEGVIKGKTEMFNFEAQLFFEPIETKMLKFESN